MRRAFATALALSAAAPALAQQGECTDGVCKVAMTADQLLASAEALVAEHRFGEAAPMIAALENAPQYALQRQFLIGYSAIELGNVDAAIGTFRKILDSHPEQTRVRLELARALMLKGRAGAADHHFRLAQSDRAIPADIARTISANRRLLRDTDQFTFGLDLGIAPDSNITNGTSAETVDIAFGNQTIPLTLDNQARQRSGTGQTVGLTSTARIGFSGDTRLLIETDANFVNYKGQGSDDIFAQIAIGPDFRLGDETRLSVTALGSHRWYGGQKAQLAGGLRASLLHNLSDSARLGFSLDARRNDSGIASAYSGWQFGGTATFEKAIARRFIASATLFGRRDALNSRSYSGTELGANLGFGGDLPLGLTAGISGGVSRAAYDAPLVLFGSEPRKDWRLNARVQLGIRAFRFLGFSPSLTYSFSKSASSLTLYDSTRHRLRFGLARYF